MKIANIKFHVHRHGCDPITCEHEWEPHMWDDGRAFCNLCGTFAEWLDDPRVERAAEAVG